MTDLRESLGAEESEALEFKRDASDRNGIREAICALANDLGRHGSGTLLIGVRDDGRPHGLTVDDKLLQWVASVRDEARILPRPTISVDRGSYGGTAVVCVRVQPCEHPPMRFDGVVWVRVGTSSRRAGPGEERVLAERRQTLDLPFDHTPVPDATLADLDLELFSSTYLRAAVDPDVLDENERSHEQQLVSLRLAGADGRPTVAGLLTLGLDPTARLLGAYVQFVRYEGIDEDATVLDEAELRGNLVAQLQDLDVRLPAHVRTRLEEDGLREHERPDFPVPALREAVVNALVHRAYEPRSPTRIVWFADRVEVVNPGGPYGVVTSANFEAMTDYRNPTLAEAAKNLGYMNRFGRGVARIRAALAANGNPEPVFAIERDYWSVTIPARA
ncbi:MAG: putative DNA binding domain-containing protein [Actinomycetota bacterium]|nr:putative DNA binding domain-containing protein [Actinomycetota bacterium]